jgi:hypothetical protein
VIFSSNKTVRHDTELIAWVVVNPTRFESRPPRRPFIVSFHYVRLLFIVSSNIYTGPIERRACALQIGHGEDMDDFEGEMDDVCIILVDVFN